MLRFYNVLQLLMLRQSDANVTGQFNKKIQNHFLKTNLVI